MSTQPDSDDAVLDALVNDLLGNGPRPVAWSRLNGEQARTQWTALDAWVRVLLDRYALDHREVPPCWYRHAALVEELSALRTAHAAAFDSGGQPTGPADWHHTLAAARGRMRDWVARTGCRNGEHRDDKPQGWATPAAPGDYADDLATFVAGDIAARDNSAA